MKYSIKQKCKRGIDPNWLKHSSWRWRIPLTVWFKPSQIRLTFLGLSAIWVSVYEATLTAPVLVQLSSRKCSSTIGDHHGSIPAENGQIRHETVPGHSTGKAWRFCAFPKAPRLCFSSSNSNRLFALPISCVRRKIVHVRGDYWNSSRINPAHRDEPEWKFPCKNEIRRNVGCYS